MGAARRKVLTSRCRLLLPPVIMTDFPETSFSSISLLLRYHSRIAAPIALSAASTPFLQVSSASALRQSSPHILDGGSSPAMCFSNIPPPRSPSVSYSSIAPTAMPFIRHFLPQLRRRAFHHHKSGGAGSLRLSSSFLDGVMPAAGPTTRYFRRTAPRAAKCPRIQ